MGEGTRYFLAGIGAGAIIFAVTQLIIGWWLTGIPRVRR